MMSIVPEEESLQSLSTTPDLKDQQRSTFQHQQHHYARSGTVTSSRSRTSETLSAIHSFGTIPTPTPTYRSSASQTCPTGSSNKTSSNNFHYGSTGDISTKQPTFQNGRTTTTTLTTFQQRPLPRSQSYNGTNLYQKQQDFLAGKHVINHVADLKWSIPPPPPEFQSGSSHSGSRSSHGQVRLSYTLSI